MNIVQHKHQLFSVMKWKSQRKIQITWDYFFASKSQSVSKWSSRNKLYLWPVPLWNKAGHIFQTTDLEIPAEQLSVSQWGSSANFRTRLWASTAIWSRPGGWVVPHSKGFSFLPSSQQCSLFCPACLTMFSNHHLALLPTILKL